MRLLLGARALRRLQAPHAAGLDCTASRTASIPSSDSELLNQWSIMLERGRAAQPQGAESLRSLLREALRVHSSSEAGVLPAQASTTLMRAYRSLQDDAARLSFFSLLAREFGVQEHAASAAAKSWLHLCARAPDASAPKPEAVQRAAERLRSAALPLYLQLLQPISQQPHGIPFLVRLRADLLAALRRQPAYGAALRSLAEDLRHALAAWFSVGLLELRRVTWEASSGAMLERLVRYEAVHPMPGGLPELKARLGPGRRVYAFLHPSLPGEPLVVLHVALLEAIPSTLEQVMLSQPPRASFGKAFGPQAAAGGSSSGGAGVGHSSSSSSSSSMMACDPEEDAAAVAAASVACCYSISSTQPGLSGVDLGNFLIKRAAQTLLAEVPHLRHIVTLSPMPGFRLWLEMQLRQDLESAAATPTAPASSAVAAAPVAESTTVGKRGSGGSDSSGAVSAAEPLLLVEERRALLYCAQQLGLQAGAGPAPGSHATATPQPVQPTTAAAASALLALLERDAWLALPAAADGAVRAPLLRLAAQYLLTARRRRRALDPVAHFHLNNGAQLWRINWRSDLSPLGLERSCGIMVNYSYDLDRVEANNASYMMEGRIDAHPQVAALLQQGGGAGGT